MSQHDDSGPAAARRTYASFAERYAAAALTKPHNALYERPATKSLLGEVKGLRLLDAGCGPGINSEALARRGATIEAVDFTPEMVDLARRRCQGLAVECRVGDLTQPLHWLADKRFDGILCALALDYIGDLKPVFAEFHRVVRRGAFFVFSMAHPMRDWMDDRTHGGGNYFDRVLFGMHWAGFGEPKPFVQCYRRALQDIFNALAGAGWTLERVLEPLPAPEMKAVAEPLYAELSRSPAFICVRARRES